MKIMKKMKKMKKMYTNLELSMNCEVPYNYEENDLDIMIFDSSK